VTIVYHYYLGTEANHLSLTKPSTYLLF